MHRHELQEVIEHLHARYRSLTDGDVATYIPELAKSPPDDFGVSLVTSGGRVFETGDADRPFTIQSISKPLTFGMAIEEFGQEPCDFTIFSGVADKNIGHGRNSSRRIKCLQ